MWFDPHIQEAFVYERIADALREAAHRGVLREVRSRRATPWRDAIHRLLHSTFFLRLKRRREGMAVR